MGWLSNFSEPISLSTIEENNFHISKRIFLNKDRVIGFFRNINHIYVQVFT